MTRHESIDINASGDGASAGKTADLYVLTTGLRTVDQGEIMLRDKMYLVSDGWVTVDAARKRLTALRFSDYFDCQPTPTFDDGCVSAWRGCDARLGNKPE
jgi:hypothetical protein